MMKSNLSNSQTISLTRLKKARMTIPYNLKELIRLTHFQMIFSKDRT